MSERPEKVDITLFACASVRCCLICDMRDSGTSREQSSGVLGLAKKSLEYAHSCRIGMVASNPRH